MNHDVFIHEKIEHTHRRKKMAAVCSNPRGKVKFAIFISLKSFAIFCDFFPVSRWSVTHTSNGGKKQDSFHKMSRYDFRKYSRGSN